MWHRSGSVGLPHGPGRLQVRPTALATSVASLPCLPATPAGTRMGASLRDRTDCGAGPKPQTCARGAADVAVRSSPAVAAGCRSAGFRRTVANCGPAARLVSSGPGGAAGINRSPFRREQTGPAPPAALSGVIFRSRPPPGVSDAQARGGELRHPAQAPRHRIPCAEVWRA